jgi:hypothetical protein
MLTRPVLLAAFAVLIAAAAAQPCIECKDCRVRLEPSCTSGVALPPPLLLLLTSTSGGGAGV